MTASIHAAAKTLNYPKSAKNLTRKSFKRKSTARKDRTMHWLSYVSFKKSSMENVEIKRAP